MNVSQRKKINKQETSKGHVNKYFEGQWTKHTMKQSSKKNKMIAYKSKKR